MKEQYSDLKKSIFSCQSGHKDVQFLIKVTKCIIMIKKMLIQHIIQIFISIFISRFGGLPESYIFPSGYIFPKRAALRENIITRENITILAPPTRDISSVPVNICYIRWSKWMISSKFDGALWLSRSMVTRLESAYKQCERKLDSFARFLLWRSIV